MTRHAPSPGGFTLLEAVVVVAILGSLAAVAMPYLLGSQQRAKSAACELNRVHIEMEERGHYSEKGTPSLAIGPAYRCPAGGQYAWLATDPADPAYPRVGCSIHYGALPASSAVQPLFTSLFDSLQGLKSLRGTWKIQNGWLVPTGTGENRLAFGDAGWRDYEIQVAATLGKGKGYGIYYRADGKAAISGYVFQYDPSGSGAFLVRKVVNGKESAPIATAKMPPGFQTFGTSHDISVAIHGSQHIIAVDGRQVLSFKDSSFATGMAGFREWGNSDARFDRVTVVP